MSNMAQHKKQRQESSDRVSQKAPNVVRIRVDEADPLSSFSPEGSVGTVGSVGSVGGGWSIASAADDAHGSAAAGVAVASPPPVSVPPRTIPAWVLMGAAALVTVAVVLGGGWLYLKYRPNVPLSAQRSPLTGQATLNSRPAGATVMVDGVAKGITPLALELPAGTHDVLFRTPDGERRISLKIESGVRVAENVDMPAAPVATGGQLDVTSDPAGARVTVDGAPAGQTPLQLRNIAAGRHVVGLSHGGGVVNRTVDVTAGATVTVFASLAGGGTVPTGSFAVDSPLELRLLENGQLLGLSNSAPLVLSAGKHQFDLVNEALELRITRAVTIESGKTVRLSVPPPNGSLSVNAAPWAEVFVDGRSIGVTPLGDVPVAVGTREIVWRHPQFGERRRTIVVGAQTPVRLAMEMNR
jgi:hypothetical protein